MQVNMKFKFQQNFSLTDWLTNWQNDWWMDQPIDDQPIDNQMTDCLLIY